MNIDHRASILSQALPYIQKFYKKTIVIKYGGNAMTNDELKMSVINNIILLSCVGINVVLVHGGGPEINDLLRRVGKESRFINGLRHTDEETMEIVQMVLCGKVNKDLVSLIQLGGGRAVGLCGLDGGLIRAKPISEDEDYGLVGQVTTINADILNTTIAGEFIPVVATVGCGEKGESYNINADTAAASIACALNAEKLILLTDVPGVMRDKNDPSTLISRIPISQVEKLEAEGIISGGMIPKVECCVEAVKNGVSRAHIIDGRLPNSILMEILSDEGIGTMFLEE